MKLKGYICERLVDHGITTCFYVNGGAIAPLIDQVAHDERFESYACLHEASAAYAAEGFTRRTGKTSAVLVTSGPGGTNAITGLNCCWADSIPVIFFSGQVSSNQLLGENRIRQRGVQETDIIKLTKNISKVSLRVEKGDDCIYVDQALSEMIEGRQGPVWIDLCIDSLNQEITSRYQSNIATKEQKSVITGKWRLEDALIQGLTESKKPLIIAGAGVAQSVILRGHLKDLDIPITSTWGGQAFVSDAKHYAGNIGLFGDRGANSAVQEADLIIAIGTSLNICHTGYDSKNFGRNALLLHMDIDEGEINKNNYHARYIGIQVDLRESKEQYEIIQMLKPLNVDQKWLQRVKQRAGYTAVKENLNTTRESGFVNSYDLVDIVSKSEYDFDIVTDMGTSFTCTHQSFKQTVSRRIITAGGHAPMGWGIAGAIGAAIGARDKKVVCITGDGGMLMSLQDLRTHTALNLNILNIVLDNNGYLTMRHTMRNTFGRLSGCSAESGIMNPDFRLLAESMGMPYIYVDGLDVFEKNFKKIMEIDTIGPKMLHVKMHEDQELKPRLASYVDAGGVKYNYPLENMYPHNNKEYEEL